MVELTRKQLVSLAISLGAVDQTSVESPAPRCLAVAVSHGVNGVNATLYRSKDGGLYYIRSRCSNLYQTL